MGKSLASSSSSPPSRISVFVSVMRQRKKLPIEARKAMVEVMEQVMKIDNIMGTKDDLELEIEGMITAAAAATDSAIDSTTITAATTTSDNALDSIDQQILNAYQTVARSEEGEEQEEEEEENYEDPGDNGNGNDEQLTLFNTECPTILQSVSGLYQKFLQLQDCPLEALGADDDSLLGLFAQRLCLYLREPIRRWLSWLDSCKDTHQQVETAIRLFPSLLEQDLFYTPILEAAMRPPSVVFVPLLAQLGLEFGSVNDRGGLLKYFTSTYKYNTNSDGCREQNALRCLAMAYPWWLPVEDDTLMRNDAINLAVMKELREQKLFFQADIAREDLIERLLSRRGDRVPDYFYGEQRLRYLVDWDPQALARKKERHFDGRLPLHESVSDNFKAFCTVLELGLEHFPDKVGFLFQMDQNHSTPFREAYRLYGNDNAEQVTKSIDQALVASNKFGAGNGKTLQALLHLAEDDTAHWEGVYYILRRDPSLIARALTGTGTRENNHDHDRGKRKQKRNRDSIADDETR